MPGGWVGGAWKIVRNLGDLLRKLRAFNGRDSENLTRFLRRMLEIVDRG